jgi:hypothetical protein
VIDITDQDRWRYKTKSASKANGRIFKLISIQRRRHVELNCTLVPVLKQICKMLQGFNLQGPVFYHQMEAASLTFIQIMYVLT